MKFFAFLALLLVLVMSVEAVKVKSVEEIKGKSEWWFGGNFCKWTAASRIGNSYTRRACYCGGILSSDSSCQ